MRVCGEMISKNLYQNDKIYAQIIMANSHSLWIRLTIFWSVMWKRTNNIHANEMRRKKKTTKQPTNNQNKRSNNNNNNDRTRKWSTNILRSARAIWPWKLFFFIIFEYCYYYYKLRMRLLPFGYIFDNVCTVAMNGDAVLLRRNGIQFFGAEKAFDEFLTIYTRKMISS